MIAADLRYHTSHMTNFYINKTISGENLCPKLTRYENVFSHFMEEIPN